MTCVGENDDGEATQASNQALPFHNPYLTPLFF